VNVVTTPISLNVVADPAPLASFPVDFTLRDDDGQAAIVIAADPAERHAHLIVTNTSGESMTLRPQPGGTDATADRYHFALRFRPGVLAAASLTGLRLVAQDGWSGSAPQVQPDGTVWVYLLRTAEDTFPAAAQLSWQLYAFAADGAGGSRPTQVELRYQGLSLPDGTVLTGGKLLHIDVTNQVGLKNFPLHIGFVGTHTVLNDDKTENQLTIRLTNASNVDVPLAGAGDAAPSRLVVWFDTGGPWGLNTPDELALIAVRVTDGGSTDPADWQIVPGSLIGQAPSWIVTHHGNDAALAAGQGVLIELSNIHAGVDAGDSNLYVRYENIPGYWDGTFVCTIEKGPLLYDRRGNVGVGTASPQRTLQVGQGGSALGVQPATGGPELRFGDGTPGRLRIGPGGVNPDGTPVSGTTGVELTVTHDGRLGIGAAEPSQPLTVQADHRPGSREGRQILVQGRTVPDQEITVGVAAVGGQPAGTVSAAWQGSYYLPLLLNPNGGDVGIGLGDRMPAASLEVSGGIRSPMWQAWTVVAHSTVDALPFAAGTVTTGGGTLMLIFNAGARTVAGASPLAEAGYQVEIDGRYTDCWASGVPAAPGRQVPLTSTALVTGIPAGSHTITVAQFSDARDTDPAQGFVNSLILLELPF
jgi:hypothetical protein